MLMIISSLAFLFVNKFSHDFRTILAQFKLEVYLQDKPHYTLKLTRLTEKSVRGLSLQVYLRPKQFNQHICSKDHKYGRQEHITVGCQLL